MRGQVVRHDTKICRFSYTLGSVSRPSSGYCGLRPAAYSDIGCNDNTEGVCAKPRTCRDESKFVRVGLGLHPQLVAQRSEEIVLFEKLLRRSRYVGEVGLDAGPRYYRSLELQKSIFERILQLCAEQGGKVLSIHSTRAATPVLDLLEERLPPDRGTAVLHWFCGSVGEARRAATFGCYFSVNERMLASPNGRRLLGEIPADRLLTETDGPFIERDGKPIAAGDVLRSVQGIAVATSRAVSDVRSLIVDNLRKLTSHPFRDRQSVMGLHRARK